MSMIQSPLKRQFSVLLGTLGLLWLAAGCASPLTAPHAQAAGPSGSLSLSVPHLADWVRQASGTSLSGARAFAVADIVKVEVKDAAGTAVIPPTTLQWKLITDYKPSDPLVTGEINGIPVGTGYTVTVSIFNRATSTSDPVIQGQAGSVTVEKGKVTPLTVTCLPVNPTPVTVDQGPWTATFQPNGERWYVLSVVKGQTYYFNYQCPLGTFTSDGLLEYNRFPLVAPSTGPLYIVLADFDGFAGLKAQGTLSFSVTSTEPPTNEGSAAAPVPLVLNQPHRFLLGPKGGAYPTSWYSFKTGTAGHYVLDAEAGDLVGTLYSDSSFTTKILTFSNSYDVNGLDFGTLKADTTYYLVLGINGPSSPSVFSGVVLDEAAITAHYEGDGTLAQPVPLTLGTTLPGKAGRHSYDSSSYYQFTTGPGKDYSVAFTDLAPAGNDLSVTLYRDASFSNSFLSTTLTADGTIFQQLVPSTTYYLKVSNGYSARRADTTTTFRLLASGLAGPPPVNEGTKDSPVALGINTSHDFKLGAYTSGYQTSYYSFTTTAAGTYAFDTSRLSMRMRLYSDAQFTQPVPNSDVYASGLVFPNLKASTTYYLQLDSDTSSVQTAKGQVLDGAALAALSLGQGSPDSPVDVPLGATFQAQVGFHSFDSVSYYRFTTGDAGDYAFTLPAIAAPTTTVYFAFSTAPIPATGGDFWYTRAGQVRTEALAARTSYYLALRNPDVRTTKPVFSTLTVTPVGPPAFLPLSIANTDIEGTITAPYAEVWYQAAVEAGKTYTLAWADSPGSFVRAGVTAYRQDRASTYFSETDWGSPQTVKVPAGDSKLFLRVRVPRGGSNTGKFTVKLY